MTFDGGELLLSRALCRDDSHAHKKSTTDDDEASVGIGIHEQDGVSLESSLVPHPTDAAAAAARASIPFAAASVCRGQVVQGV